MQKIKEKNNQPPRTLLVDHKRGQKFRNSWKATEDGSLTEMQRNLGMKSMCQATSRETTGEGKEDGGRVYTRDAMRDASCSTRGSQQQMDMFKWT